MSRHPGIERHSPLDDACFLDALERVLERGVHIDAHIGVDVCGIRLVDVRCRIKVYVEQGAAAHQGPPRSVGAFGPGFVRDGILGSGRGGGPRLPDHLRN